MSKFYIKKFYLASAIFLFIAIAMKQQRSVMQLHPICKMDVTAESIGTFLASTEFDIIQFLALFQPKRRDVGDYELWHMPLRGDGIQHYAIEYKRVTRAFDAIIETLENTAPRLISRTALEAEVDLGFQHLRGLPRITQADALAFLKKTIRDDDGTFVGHLLGDKFDDSVRYVLDNRVRFKNTVPLSVNYQLYVGDECPPDCDATIRMEVHIDGRVWNVHIIHLLKRYMARDCIDACSTLFLTYCYKTHAERKGVQLDSINSDRFSEWLFDFARGEPETFVVETLGASKLHWDRREPDKWAFTQAAPISDAQWVEIAHVLCRRLALSQRDEQKASP